MSARSHAVPPVRERDHVRGAEHPRLTLIEYGDFGCPFCFAAKRPIDSLLDRYDGLQLVWRHLPDPDLHPGADLAAELSELAAAHQMFWEAHELLLAGRESFTADRLRRVAEELGIDRTEAESALAQRIYRPHVLEDVAGAEGAGARGTPSLFLNGERLVGHWRQLAQLVPSMLAVD